MVVPSIMNDIALELMAGCVMAFCEQYAICHCILILMAFLSILILLLKIFITYNDDIIDNAFNGINIFNIAIGYIVGKCL